MRKLIFILAAVISVQTLCGPLFARNKDKVECEDFLVDTDFRVRMLPGLIDIIFEDKFHVGYATWLRGVDKNGARILASYEGSQFTLSIDGSEAKEGTCKELGIFGDGYTLRKYTK